LVELSGAGSTHSYKAPPQSREYLSSIKGKSCKRKEKKNCFEGLIDKQVCIFKIDTGSDVSVISSRLIDSSKRRIPLDRSCCLKYPTGEEVAVKFKTKVFVELGKFSVEFTMFVAEIDDDCLLGIDFLSTVGLGNIFDSYFGDLNSGKERFFCSRIKSFENEIPFFIKELYERESMNLNEDQRNHFAQLLKNNLDVFSEEITAGNCDILEHKIILKDSNPIKQAPRRIPLKMREEVDNIVEDMKRQGVIEESQSPWVSPAVMVKKKDGSVRFCVDYRRLNAVTVKDSYPIPRIDDMLDRLSGNSWFSTLDLKSGYWQVKIRSEDKEKTAFSIGKGLWQFTVMPFGLCNAPATFERLMEKILNQLLFKICLVYLDDVIIYSDSFEGMLSRLEQVFERLRSANLKLNPKKCCFFKREIRYLGHVVTREGIKTDPEKISAVRDWPIPRTKKQIRSFLGFCSYYRKFIKGFSLIAKPLFSLTEDSVKFVWTEKCEEAFKELKKHLVSSPILSYPDSQGCFILDTDASNHGLGAVLSQKQGGIEKVIAYFSRVLNKSERNYCVTRRELLAIVESLRSFHHYLYGSRFVVRTDHISLRWLMSFKNLEGQLARWLERIQQYDFEITYRGGKSHSNADGLSRRPCIEMSCNYCNKTELKEKEKIARIILGGNNLESWRKEQLEDATLVKIIRGKEEGQRPTRQEITSEGSSAKAYWLQWDSLLLRDGVLHKKWESPNLKINKFQLIVPQKKIKQILEEVHDSPSGGHFGVNKTLDRVRRRYYWVTCKSDVEDWCRSCKICIAKKGPSDKGKSELQLYNVGGPFERVQMDILGPFPASYKGNKYLLVISDCFTKWVEAFPLKNFKASTIAEVFVNQVVSRFGVPSELHTDQGRNFDSRIFKELSGLLGIKKTRTTPFHPQSNGLVERQHQTLTNYLAKFVSENQRDWDRWIGMSLLAYRSARQETTGISPAELCLGRELKLPIDLIYGSPPTEEENSSIENYVSKLKTKLNKIHNEVRNRINMRTLRSKMLYDRKARLINYEPGQKVWLYNPRKVIGRAPKLQSNWEGPYEIVKKINDVVYCIRKSYRHKNKVVHSDRLASYYRRQVE